MFSGCCKKKVTGVDLPDEIAKNAVRNVYLGKRNLVHSMVDFGLLAANGSQLKTLLNREHYQLFETSTLLISLSMALQVAFVVCMLIISLKEKNIYALKNYVVDMSPLTSLVKPNEDLDSNKTSERNDLNEQNGSSERNGPSEGNERTVKSRVIRRINDSIDRLDSMGNILVLLTVVVNVLIFLFGIEHSDR